MLDSSVSNRAVKYRVAPYSVSLVYRDIVASGFSPYHKSHPIDPLSELVSPPIESSFVIDSSCEDHCSNRQDT